jgi:hypothetical protein
MDVPEYWIGRGVDYRAIWNAYEGGTSGYIDKYFSAPVYLLRLKFGYPPYDKPLFNHEALYKTLKGYFHDLKYACLPRTIYNDSGPLYLYKIDRSSGVWDLLAGLRELLLFGTTLSDEKVIGEQLSNVQKKLDILKEHFGDSVHPEDFFRFMNARSSSDIDIAVQKLLEQRLLSAKLSKTPFVGSLENVEMNLIELKSETDPGPESPPEPEEGPPPMPLAGAG